MQFSFCPKCGSALAFLLVEGRNRQVCSRCNFIFYQNSKPCASVLVVDQDEVLLVRRAVEPFQGWWDIPGGFLEPGEHPADGARREIREETGLEIELVSLLGIWMDIYGPDQEPTLNHCYIGRTAGGQARAGTDASELEWFPLHMLPENVAFDWSLKALHLLRRQASYDDSKGPRSSQAD
jgi:8-oxo-dGTP diphosphatase